MAMAMVLHFDRNNNTPAGFRKGYRVFVLFMLPFVNRLTKGIVIITTRRLGHDGLIVPKQVIRRVAGG